jgi:two-component system, NtrC family, sensor kinase
VDTPSQIPVHPAQAQAESARRAIDALGGEIESSHRLVMLGTMTAAIAHEINNALTPVITYCQLAKAHPEDVELQRKALDRAALGAERAARISGVVLDLARGTSMAGGLAEESAEADLVGVARAVVESLVRDPAKDGIAVRIESVGVERRAKIRPTALHQALLNLVLNGVRVLGSGGSLVIRCVDDRSTGWVGIDVEDSGPGIAPEVREKLFSAFASGFRAEGGTGLGLLVVRTLIEDAGGRISVGDAPGGGTVFHVELPAAGAGVGAAGRSAA